MRKLRKKCVQGRLASIFICGKSASWSNQKLKFVVSDIIEFASSSISTVDLPPRLCLTWLHGCSEDIR